MSVEINISAFAAAECAARTVDDLRDLVRWLDEHRVPGEISVDWGGGKVYVELTGEKSVPAEWIECGDHMPPAIQFDILVPTHDHPEHKQYPENYEEALEMALDRYGDERRPE